MYLKTFERPPDRNLTYLFGPQGTTAALACVDPGADVAPVLEEANGREIRLIFATHGHEDHIEGLAALKARTGGSICGHRLLGPDFERRGIPLDIALTGGQRISLDGLEIRVLYTPGHHPASVCLLVAERILFSGDTLFVGNCGRTDLPGGDERSLFMSMRILSSLPDDVVIHPGHNYGKTATARLGQQRKKNAALAAETLEAFQAVP